MINNKYARAPPIQTIYHRGPNKKRKKDNAMPEGGTDPKVPAPPQNVYRDSMGKEISLELSEWDPRTLPDHFFLTLEGKRRTGKSTFAKWLLQWYKDKFSLVWCMTLTKASGYWQELVGDEWTFDNWYAYAVLKLIERGDMFIKKYGEDNEIAKKLGSSLLILDDVISARIHDDPTFNRLATEGRHHLISVILMTQDPHAISPKVRDNSDVAVVFNMKTYRNKESIWRDFMNDVDKNTAQLLLERYAVNHDALVCVQTNLDGKLQKNFFRSASDKTKLADPDYALGSNDQKAAILKGRQAKKKRDDEVKRQSVHIIPTDAKATNFTEEKILNP